MDNNLIVEIKIWKGDEVLHHTKGAVQEPIIWDLYGTAIPVNDIDIFLGYQWQPKLSERLPR